MTLWYLLSHAKQTTKQQNLFTNTEQFIAFQIAGSQKIYSNLVLTFSFRTYLKKGKTTIKNN